MGKGDDAEEIAEENQCAKAHEPNSAHTHDTCTRCVIPQGQLLSKAGNERISA